MNDTNAPNADDFQSLYSKLLFTSDSQFKTAVRQGVTFTCKVGIFLLRCRVLL
jgi:hypothetical protein